MSLEISFLVQKINQVKEITRGGWSGFGMATVGIDPTNYELNPTKIPPGGVVQNCPKIIRHVNVMLKIPKLKVFAPFPLYL